MNHQLNWSLAAAGDPVWVSDTAEAYIEGSIVTVKGRHVTIDTKSGKRFTVDTSISHDRHARPPSASGRRHEDACRRLLPRSRGQEGHAEENMDNLHPLNEAEIMSNIERRFRGDSIYTRTGPILIAMNPFCWLPIYGSDVVNRYHKRPLDGLPPHCFQEAEDAYQQLQLRRQNQSLIICGESGAGKTETTKLILQYLSIIARERSQSQEARSTTIGEKLVQSNPLMEAFGNAKTVRNNNSSRFGKFTMLHFGKNFQISGGRVSNFLLEKSRVVRQPKHERNYHIFYQLIAGASAELRAELHLPGPDDFRRFFYLAQSGCIEVEGVNDAQDFAALRLAMEAIGMSVLEQNELFTVVAGILHLGNVDFTATDDGESSKVSSDSQEALALASELLGIQPEHLAEALISRVRQLPGSKSVRSPQTDSQSRDSRDALAKAVYNKLFDDLVSRINTTFDQDSSPDPPFIGILDIFGFEDMAFNGFEQLLINFTNEKLQLLFNEATFKMEEEEYLREQIHWNRTDFPDNGPCLELIEKKPMGLLPVLDSECSRGTAASDAALAATYNRSFRDHPHYSICGGATAWRKSHNNHSFTTENDFVVTHFAGPVVYTCEEFVDKNRDALFEHVSSMMASSSKQLISGLFCARAENDNALRAGTVTVAQRFSSQLSSLIQTLQSCDTRFVRCIKSNPLLQPRIIDKPSVLKQLVCSGVMAALEVRRAGFPTRVPYAEFVKEFRVLGTGFPKFYANCPDLHQNRTPSQLSIAWFDTSVESNERQLTARMMTHPAVLHTVAAKKYCLGLTKLFLHADTLVSLQSIRNRIVQPQIVKIQRWWRHTCCEIIRCKIQRAAICLKDVQTMALMKGVHKAQDVRQAVLDYMADLGYARGRTMTACCRSEINGLMPKIAAVRKVVEAAVAAKEGVAQERARLLEVLDSGQAQLTSIQDGLQNVKLDTDAVQRSADRATQALLDQKQALLSILSQDCLQQCQSVKETETNFSSEQLQQAFTGAESASVGQPDIAQKLHQSRKRVSRVLSLVADTQMVYDSVLNRQRTADQAREATRLRLCDARASEKQALEVAEAAGVSHVLVVSQAFMTARSLLSTAQVALEGYDVALFEAEVDKAGQMVAEVMAVIEKERQRKYQDEQRAQGQACLQHVSDQLSSISRKAEAVGVRRYTSVAAAIDIVEEAVYEAHLLGAGRPAEFLEACLEAERQLNGAQSAVSHELSQKAKCDEQRRVEMKRLQRPLDRLREMQSGISQNFQLAAQAALCAHVSAAIGAIEQTRIDLEQTQDVTLLSDRVSIILQQAETAEQLYFDTEKRLEVQMRELNAARAQHTDLEARLNLVVQQVETFAEESTLLLELVDDHLQGAKSALGDLKAIIGREKAGEALRIALRRAADQTNTLETVVTLQGQRVQAGRNTRRDQMARVNLASRRMQELLSAEVQGTPLEDREVVRNIISATQSAIEQLETRYQLPLSAQWLQEEQVGKERTALGHALCRLEELESVILRERARIEAWTQEKAKQRALLEGAGKRIGQVAQLHHDYSLEPDSGVGLSLQECRVSFEVSKRLVAHAGLDEDQQEVRRALRNLDERLSSCEACGRTAQASREAEDREQASLQRLCSNLLARHQTLMSSVHGADPAVEELMLEQLRQVSSIVDEALEQLRCATDVKGLGDCVCRAEAAVSAAEVEAAVVNDQVTEAIRLKSSYNVRLVALEERVMSFREKAQDAGIDRVNNVATALHRAEEALTVLSLCSTSDLIAWIHPIKTLAADLHDAVRKVEVVESTIDQEVKRREAAQRQKRNLQQTVQLLAGRHEAVAQAIRDSTSGCSSELEAASGCSSELQEAADAAETELLSVEESLQQHQFFAQDTMPIMLKLRRLVGHEERLLAVYRRRRRVSCAGIQKAEKNLPQLVEEMRRLQTAVNTSLIGTPLYTPELQKVVESAQKCIWQVQRFVTEGWSNNDVCDCSCDSASAQLDTAAALVQRQVDLVARITQQRTKALTRMRLLESKLTDLQDQKEKLCLWSELLHSELDTNAGQDGALVPCDNHDNHASGAASSLNPMASLLTRSFEAAESAVHLLKQVAEADIGTWAQTSTSAAVAQAFENAHQKLTEAGKVLAAEEVVAHKGEQDRLSASRILGQQSDRLTKLRVNAQAQGLAAGTSELGEALSNAERSLDMAAARLADRREVFCFSAVESTVQQVSAVEASIQREIESKVRFEARRAAASKELSNLRLKRDAIMELVSTLEVLETSETQQLEELEELVRRAAYVIDAAGMDVPAQEMKREVQAVQHKLEQSERCVRKAYIRKQEVDRLRQQQETEARIHMAHKAEADRKQAEAERLRKVHVENEMEKLKIRLSLYQPFVEKLQMGIEQAASAVYTAQSKLGQDSVVAAEAAVQSALQATLCFEQTAASILSASFTNALEIPETELLLTQRCSGTLKALPAALNSSMTAGQCKIADQVLHSRASMRAVSNPIVTDSVDSSLPGLASELEVVQKREMQAFINRNNEVVELLADRVQDLGETVKSLGTSLPAQTSRQLIDCASVSSCDSPGRYPARTSGESCDSADQFSPSQYSSPKPLVRRAARRKGRPHGSSLDPWKYKRSRMPESDEETDRQTPLEPDDSPVLSYQATLEEPHYLETLAASHTVSATDLEIQMLLDRVMPNNNPFELLRDRRTQGGVKLQDCIACSSFDEADTLELFAGDHECYSLFAELFQPVMKAAHAHFSFDQQDRQPRELVPERIWTLREPEPVCQQIRKTRFVFSRNLRGYNYTPAMTRDQLLSVERTVCAALEGSFDGCYTTVAEFRRDRGLIEELVRAELPLTQQAGANCPHWPDGRGFFLSSDRSLCVFINIEDHVTVVTTADRGSLGKKTTLKMAHEAFSCACEALQHLAARMSFEWDDHLGYITPSPAKLGTAMAFSLILRLPDGCSDTDLEERFRVCLDRTSLRNRSPMTNCILYNSATLGVSEIDSIKEVMDAASYLVARCESECTIEKTSYMDDVK